MSDRWTPKSAAGKYAPLTLQELPGCRCRNYWSVWPGGPEHRGLSQLLLPRTEIRNSCHWCRYQRNTYPASATSSHYWAGTSPGFPEEPPANGLPAESQEFPVRHHLRPHKKPPPHLHRWNKRFSFGRGRLFPVRPAVR